MNEWRYQTFMNILLIGCGKVGSKLAIALCNDGHDVTIVDRDESNFKLLASEFTGFTTSGVPIDLDVLRKAGIENCDAVAVVSSDDNTNIMVSQVAKEIFKVPIVITRIYDPAREDLFSHFGLKTICPTNLTVSAVRSALNANENVTRICFDANCATFTTIDPPKHFIGKSTREMVFSNNETLFAISREGSLVLPNKTEDIKIKATDKLIIAEIVD